MNTSVALVSPPRRLRRLTVNADERNADYVSDLRLRERSSDCQRPVSVLERVRQGLNAALN